MVLSPNGVTGDWLNELQVPLGIYESQGMQALNARIRQHPVRTYHERMHQLIQNGRQDPEYAAQTRQEYAINDSNRKTVERIDARVRLLNSAAQQDILSARVFEMFYTSLIKSVRGNV